MNDVVTVAEKLYYEKNQNTRMDENGINVLSLFDGMSCGQIALERELP